MKKERNMSKDILILSATLFSMFFGAGNLIFPPSLGFEAGSKWFPALVGFFLTGTGLPLLGIIASAKSDGDINKLGEKVSPKFSMFLGIIVVLAIGPLMGIPRTGATTYEIAINPIIPNFSPVLFAIIYFTIAFLLVLNPTDIVNKIGKILTPALIILLILIITLGIKSPMGSIANLEIDNSFTVGFEGGYQTMDALAALLFGGIIVLAIKNLGYKSTKTQISMTLKSGIIAVIALTVIYGGLGYLGATASAVAPKNISKVQLIMAIAENSLGAYGKTGLSIVVALACLTTTVGLIATVGQYFNKLSKGKLSYKLVITITTIGGAILSVVGVDNIVKFSGPILSFIYPVVIVLIALTIVLNNKTDKKVFQFAICFTMVISFIQLLIDFNLLHEGILLWLPFAKLKLAWIVPTLLGMLIGKIFSKRDCLGEQQRKKQEVV